MEITDLLFANGYKEYPYLPVTNQYDFPCLHLIWSNGQVDIIVHTKENVR